MYGKIYLIPVTLGGKNFADTIPAGVLQITSSLRCFIVEDIRSARRYLRMIDRNFPIDDTTFFELNEHTGDEEILDFLKPLENGSDLGLMSEAGLPCIADPGAKITAAAHKKNIKIIPLAGPSSIIMGLISSGMNGQNFAFHGYLPVKPDERSSKLKDIEKRSLGGETQVFMETPYRNQKMFDAILSVCQPETRLCIAADITLATEEIRTQKIADWKRKIPLLNDRLVVFLIQA